jgi:hypothetical protein
VSQVATNVSQNAGTVNHVAVNVRQNVGTVDFLFATMNKRLKTSTRHLHSTCCKIIHMFLHFTLAKKDPRSDSLDHKKEGD